MEKINKFYMPKFVADQDKYLWMIIIRLPNIGEF